MWDELSALMGFRISDATLSSIPPTVIMMVGLKASVNDDHRKVGTLLQGSGKRQLLLIAADPRRPAACEQLGTLGESLDVPVHRAERQAGCVGISVEGVHGPARRGLTWTFSNRGAGSHMDDELMKELVA